MKFTRASTGSDSLRASFWLHDISLRGQERFDTAAASPTGYDSLTEEERLTVAEFIEFLMKRRADPAGEQRRKFFLRDRANRPASEPAALPCPADAPIRYSELAAEERCHTIEFIAFLFRRRQLVASRDSQS